MPKTTPRIDATGTRRRLEALRWLGYTTEDITHMTGLYKDTIRRIHRRHTIRATTAAKIRHAYERHAFEPFRRPLTPDQQTARIYALRAGYAPPMAWENIDDPNEQPQGIRPITWADRTPIEEAVWLLDAGEDPTVVAARMGILTRSLARQLYRCGYPEWAAHCEREATP